MYIFFFCNFLNFIFVVDTITDAPVVLPFAHFHLTCSCAFFFFQKWNWCLKVGRILKLCCFASFLSEKKKTTPPKNLFNSCQQCMEVLISPTLANSEHSYSKRSLYSCAMPCGSTHSALDCGFTSPTSPKKTFQNSRYPKISCLHEVWGSAEVVLWSLRGFGIRWI